MNRQVNIRTQKGFTLIELLLAMTFISILLFAIAMTLVQIAATYNKGTMTKDINQSAREISDELTKAVNSSGSFSLASGEHHYVATVSAGQTIGGRLCVGNYSYIWNYPKAISPTSLDSNRNVFSTPAVNAALPLALNTVGTNYEISLVKVNDTGGAYCIPGTGGVYPKIDKTKSTELLRNGDHSFVVHYFTITQSATDTVSAQTLYKATFIIGTSDLSAVTDTGKATAMCIVPGQPGADPNYCSVQKFTIVLRVASGVN